MVYMDECNDTDDDTCVSSEEQRAVRPYITEHLELLRERNAILRDLSRSVNDLVSLKTKQMEGLTRETYEVEKVDHDEDYPHRRRML